jgi:type II secretory pathway component GspD/PulD (secretin)
MNKNISMQTGTNKKQFAPNAVGVGLGLAILLAAGALPISTANAMEPKWPSGPYKYLVVDQDLRDALTEFGRSIGVAVKVSETLAGHRLRGKLPEGTAQQYLKQLCESYGIVWFYDGAVMHFSSETEIKTEQVDLRPVSADAVTKKLKSLGVIEANYPIRTIDAHSISVFGPPPYITFVRQTVTAMQKAMSGKVRVIRGGVEGS